MERSVPAGMSPVWSGTSVWQLRHLQIWWDPRWRTGSQPRSCSLRSSARALTFLVYPDRRLSV